MSLPTNLRIVVRVVPLVSLALAFLIIGSGSQAKSQTRQTPTPAVSPQPEATPAAQFLLQGESLSLILDDISKRLSSGVDVGALTARVEAREEEIQAKSAATLGILGEAATTVAELQNVGEYWRVLLESNVPLQADLARTAAIVREDTGRLQVEQAEWQTILDQAQGPNSMDPAYDRVREALLQIQNLLASAKDRERKIASLQLRLTAENSLATDLRERINRATQQFQRKLVERDSLPIWRFSERRQAGEAVDSSAREPVRPDSTISLRFIKEQTGTLAAIVVVFLLNLALALSLRNKWKRRAAESSFHAQVAEIFRHPISVSLLAASILTALLKFSAPLALMSLMGLAMVIPVLRLLPPVIGSHWCPLLYLLSFTFIQTVIQTAIRHSFVPASPLIRELDALFILGVIICFAYLTLRPAFRDATGSDFWSRATVRAARVTALLLVVSLNANVFGFLRLSQVISRATIYSAFVGVILFTAVRLTMITLNAVLKTDRARALATVRLRKNAILQWTNRVIATLAILYWMVTTSDLFMSREPLRAALVAILTWRLTLGTLSFTLGSILTVVLVLFVGFGFSTAVRFVLREEVLSRIHLSRGLPELITTLLYYGLSIVVVVLAFGAAGVEFSRLTLITGALGVGIGFGLQNIVNNFVSGLILQFERPIHVGDILEVGGLSGEVTRIGVRSSTIQTAQGAEVIVPNAELVAGRVINWTLSSERRRVDIPVVVAHGTETKRVIELLTRVALENQSVMRSPEPIVLFQGLTDTGLAFELRFWAPDRTSYPQLRSDVALAVIEALSAAKIETPTAQRDLYLKAIEDAVREKFGGALTVSGVEPPAPGADGGSRPGAGK